MQHHRPQPHIDPSGSPTPGGAASVISDSKHGKKRGSYNCGRCGLPKKGHSCHVKTPTPASATTPTGLSASSYSAISAPSSVSAVRQPSHLRRALSFDDVDDNVGGFNHPEPDDGDDGDPSTEPEPDLDPSGLPASLLWEVLRRLPPAGLLSAAKVCKGWRDTTRRLWRAAEELRLRVPARVQVGFVAAMLQKCPGLTRLSLRMERCGFCLICQTRPDLPFYVADPVKFIKLTSLINLIEVIETSDAKRL